MTKAYRVQKKSFIEWGEPAEIEYEYYFFSKENALKACEKAIADIEEEEGKIRIARRQSKPHYEYWLILTSSGQYDIQLREIEIKP